jgi:hypothetical protein
MIRVHIYDTETDVHTEAEFEPKDHKYVLFLGEHWHQVGEKMSRNEKKLKLTLTYDPSITSLQEGTDVPMVG